MRSDLMGASMMNEPHRSSHARRSARTAVISVEDRTRKAADACEGSRPDVEQLVQQLREHVSRGTQVSVAATQAAVVLEFCQRRIVVECATPPPAGHCEPTVEGAYRVGALEILWAVEEIVAEMAARHPDFFQKAAAAEGSSDTRQSMVLLGSGRSGVTGSSDLPLIMERVITRSAARQRSTRRPALAA